MTTTARLGLTLLEDNQSQPEVTMNNALNRLEVFCQMAVIDRDLTAPPGSPSEGDTYIPATGASGDWTGLAGKLVFYFGGWISVTPKEGMVARVLDENISIFHDGTRWCDTSGTATLSGGTVTVTIAGMTSAANIQATRKTSGGTPGHLTCAPGSGTLVISSSSGSDTSVVAWGRIP